MKYKYIVLLLSFYFLQPFVASHKPSRLFVFLMILATWFLSFLFAILPFSASLQFMFEDRALIEDNYFFQNVSVSLSSAKSWAEKLLTYDPAFLASPVDMIKRIQNTASWQELQSLVGSSNVAFALKTAHYFG